MPSIVFTSTSKKDFSQVLSIDSFKERYLSGLPLPDSVLDSTMEFYIQAAVSELESFLGLRLLKTIVNEDKGFYRDDWSNWGYIPTSYPVVCPISLNGYLGTTKQVAYPNSWISARRTDDGKYYQRSVYLVPTANSSHSEVLVGSGAITTIANQFSSRVPNYWRLSYTTGFDILPKDIENCLGMMAAIPILLVISDALMQGVAKQTLNSQGQPILTGNGSGFGGLGFGLASRSVSIDGLSQSVSSYINGSTSAWNVRVKTYSDMLDTKKPGSLLNRLYDQYAAITFGAC